MFRQCRRKKYSNIAVFVVLTAALFVASSISPVNASATTTLPQPVLLQQIDLRPFNQPDPTDPATPPDFYRASAQFGDLNNDGVYKDFIRYTNSRLQAFTYAGDTSVTKLWEFNAPVSLPPAPERYFYKYTLWDVDRDNRTEVIGPFATSDGIVVRIVDGATGAVEREFSQFPLHEDGRTGKFPLPTSDDSEETLRIYATIANVRGSDVPQDIVVLTEEDSEGDIFVFTEKLNLLWHTAGDNATKEKIYAHYPWTGDIDGDGKDEFIGAWALDDDGTQMARLTPPAWEPADYYFDHLDRAFFGDFDPKRSGMEVLLSHEYVYAALYAAEDLSNPTAQPLWIREDLPDPSEDQRPGRNNRDGDAKINAIGEFTVTGGIPAGIEIAYQREIYRDRDPEETGVFDITGNEPKTILRVDDGFHMDWDGDRTLDESFSARHGAVSVPWNNGELFEVEDFYYANGGPALTPLPVPDLNRNGKVDSNEDMRVYAYALDILGDYREEVVLIDNDEMAIYGAAGSGEGQYMSPWAHPTYQLAIANSAYDNHPERSWFDWRTITPEKLNLTSMCDGRWQVRNKNDYDITFSWDVYHRSESGSGVAKANDDVLFHTSQGSKTVRLFVNGAQVDVKASNPSSCRR
ncbi:MAG: hypothetical protein MI924_28420 [Chloroflexales bacterium]|nr:hypothetical protein [Chloroflexales bacterium]